MLTMKTCIVFIKTFKKNDQRKEIKKIFICQEKNSVSTDSAYMCTCFSLMYVILFMCRLSVHGGGLRGRDGGHHRTPDDGGGQGTPQGAA